MDIHPLLVHFPIALLVAYAIMEMIHTDRLNHSDTYASIKSFLVIAGTLLAFVTLSTGEISERLLLSSRPDLAKLIETHSAFAGASTTIFSILALSYLIKFFLDSKYANAPVMASGPFARALGALNWYSRAIRENVLGQMLALAGIICITITGGLGAAIVYGPDADPIVSVIYRLFF
ncbi:MAG: DUF2231 domain-containing protein [Patescibacteria group bacterium]